MDSDSTALQGLPGWQLAALAATLSLAFIGLVYGYHPVWRYKLRKIPGPAGAWLTGSLPDVLAHGVHVMYTEWGKKYGKVFKYFSGAQPVVVINDAELARLVSLRLSTRHEFRGPASLFTGKEKEFNKSGLFSTNDKDFHRSAKNSWLPVFNSASLEISSKEMNVGADRLAAILSRAAQEGRELNIWRQFGHMTMDVVGSAAFGVELRTQEAERGMNSEEAEKLVWAAQTIFATGSEKSSIYTYPGAILPVLNPLMKALAHLFPDKGITQAIQARKVLRGTVAELVKETRRQESEGGKKEAAAGLSQPAPTAASGKRARAVEPGSFLNLMINSKHSNGEPFSDLLASSQAFTFLLAGYETTASALAFTVYCLAKYPEKMDKLVKELDAYGADTFGPSDLPKLPYLEACLKEAMRLYPPGVFLIREPLTEDFHLMDITIPKGTWVHIHAAPTGSALPSRAFLLRGPIKRAVPVFSIQRDEKYFPKAQEFVPERWVEGCPEEKSLNRHVPGSWMAFGEGTRVCVGQRFALVEAKITLAKLFRRFTFKLSPGQETDEAMGLRSFFTLGPAEGIFVTPVQRSEE